MPTLASACLSSVESEPSAGTMYLTFRNGRSYTLHGVPEYHYHGPLDATSPGWYFNTYLLGRY